MAVSVRMLKTLENFRKEHIKKAKVCIHTHSHTHTHTLTHLCVQEEKKRFDAASTKYYSHLERYLSKKEPGSGGGVLTEVGYTQCGGGPLGN